MNYETKIELSGEDLPALIEYEIDGKGPEGILVISVLLRRCVAQRGDVVYHPDGTYHKATFPEFISIDIFNFLRGSQIKSLAEAISADLADQNWNEVMNEPNYINYEFPTNYAGVSA